MPERRDICVIWLMTHLEMAELILLRGIKADDLPSDDSCVICQERYGTLNEDGTTPEYAVRFPCGHAVGNECFQNWLHEVFSLPGCLFCKKPMVPALYMKEQVEEISTIVKTTSPESIHEEVNNKTIRGSLTRSMEALRRYVSEAPLPKGLEGSKSNIGLAFVEVLKGSDSNKNLVKTFGWLITASSEFLIALEEYAAVSPKKDGHDTKYKVLWQRKRDFRSIYLYFQDLVENLAEAQMLKDDPESSFELGSRDDGIDYVR